MRDPAPAPGDISRTLPRELEVKPLVWRDEADDGYRLFTAETTFGRFVYGTDKTGQPYHQTPCGEVDHADEDVARLAAETDYEAIVVEKVLSLTVPAQRSSPPVVSELETLLRKYAEDCDEALTWGGPTIHPRNPIDAATARKFAKALAHL